MTVDEHIVVTVDPELCMGVRSCVRTAPGAFDFSGNVAHGRPDPAADLVAIIEAAESCPNFAITVAVDGEVVFDPESR